MAVAPQDVKRAVAEIERQAAETRFVGIFLSLGKVLMGDRHFYPLYEIAEHYGLAFSGAPNRYARPPDRPAAGRRNSAAPLRIQNKSDESISGQPRQLNCTWGI